MQTLTQKTEKLKKDPKKKPVCKDRTKFFKVIQPLPEGSKKVIENTDKGEVEVVEAVKSTIADLLTHL